MAGNIVIYINNRPHMIDFNRFLNSLFGLFFHQSTPVPFTPTFECIDSKNSNDWIIHFESYSEFSILGPRIWNLSLDPEVSSKTFLVESAQVGEIVLHYNLLISSLVVILVGKPKQFVEHDKQLKISYIWSGINGRPSRVSAKRTPSGGMRICTQHILDSGPLIPNWCLKNVFDVIRLTFSSSSA